MGSLTGRVRFLTVVIAAVLVAACESLPLPSSASPAPASVTGVPTPSAAPPAPSTAPVAFHWEAPDDGSTVRDATLTLRVTADGPAYAARITFSVAWPGSGTMRACEDVRVERSAWRCDVDLGALGASRGTVRARFDVDRGNGQVERSPDGTLRLDYRPPLPVWSTARTILPKSCPAPSLTVASGRYHVASACRDAIRYAEGTADGPWTQTRFDPPADHRESGPQLALDGDTLYLAYTRYGPTTDADTCGGPYSVWYEDLGVYYRTRMLPDGAWSKPRRLGQPDDILDSLRVVDGRIHAIVLPDSGMAWPVFESSGDGSVVRKRLRGVGGPMSLRVGSDGMARIAYVARDGIRLVTTDGTDATSTVAANRGRLVDPLLVLGPRNQPHLVWTRYAGEDEGCGGGAPISPQGTYYSTFVDGAWTTERVTKATGPKSFVIDPDSGAVHVLVNGDDAFDGGGKLRHFERAPGGTWTSTALRDLVGSGALIRRDESDGTLVVVFKDRYKDPVQLMTRR